MQHIKAGSCGLNDVHVLLVKILLILNNGCDGDFMCSKSYLKVTLTLESL